MRALGWGTLYSVTGFSVLCYAVWKLMAVKDVSMRHCFPAQINALFMGITA